MIFPLSPVLSVADSLDGIDDLDAYLAQCAPLSHFPTPRLKHRDSGIELDEDEGSFVDTTYNNDYTVAASLAKLASPALNSESDTVYLICRFLRNADLSTALLAIAANVLAALNSDDAAGCQASDEQPCLLVLAALGLAVTLTDDHPSRSNAWSIHVSEGVYSSRRISACTRNMLADLDSRLHCLTSPHAIDAGQAMLLRKCSASMLDVNDLD